MKFAALLVIFGVSIQTHALVINDSKFSNNFCKRNSTSDTQGFTCAGYTTTSLPTLIVDDATDEEVWNTSNEELLAQYRSELNGSSEIYAIKRYADIRTNGNVESAKREISRNLEILESNQK